MAPDGSASYLCIMSFRQTALERAFELARTGRYASAAEVRLRLRDEGYDTRQLEGRSLLKQLRDLCADARKLDGQEAS